ncbi:DUF7676 family protein [Sphingomonas crocodyli]|uniref:Uncharacterized protein n=1 Tax=Sphingomonas crocodyli TaxID=1979270 RepID=A0A437M007_9SPHN|nr:hypothetical protein [Sphingomonas crocodyli]RVT91007.1 hypothetical protein EOD43_15870 [Sphingomonas crocodyli]
MPAPAVDHPIEKRVTKVDGRTEEVWPLPLDRDWLFALFSELFDDHWDKLTWGPLIPGAAYELKCPGKPEKITLSKLGYFTCHWGAKGHFHLCLGAGPAMAPEDAIKRSPARVELVRRLDVDEMPISWSIRMFNGAGDPQISIYLPNPFLRPEDRIADEPDWDRLTLWNDLFPRLTGQPTDGRDRMGKGYAKTTTN